MKRAILIVLFGGALGAQEHTTPGIAGQITDAKAMKWLYGNYDAKAHTSEIADTLASPYASQSATADGKQQWYFYWHWNEKNNTCHGCMVNLGAALFQKEGDWWVEKISDQNITAMGNSGNPPPSRTVKWGPGRYGLVLEDGYLGYGVLTQHQHLIGLVGTSFQIIFSINVSFNNGGAIDPDPEENFETKWTFGPAGPKDAFDLVVKVEKGKHATETPVPGVYRFDGEVYRDIKTGEALKE